LLLIIKLIYNNPSDQAYKYGSKCRSLNYHYQASYAQLQAKWAISNKSDWRNPYE